MSNKEQQEEELEVLESIYDGDEQFKKISNTVFQYKYGEDNSYKSLIVEISWGENYPEEAPTVNLDTFYNKHIVADVKTKITDGLNEQIQDLLETAMTYTLFEYVKENYDDLVSDQPDAPPLSNTRSDVDISEKVEIDESSKKKEKKEQLSKHQKRRLYEKMGNATGEKPRGWNWVDIVKHLSQTGSQDS